MDQEPAYHHVQRAPMCILLYILAVGNFALAGTIRNEPVMQWLFLGVGVLMLLLATSFHYLEVTDLGDGLRISFGPLPLFRRTIRYADIVCVELGRTTLLDGWGIHWSLRGGVVWNLWGRDCVVLQLKDGVLRLGSDDAVHLAKFLQTRLAVSH